MEKNFKTLAELQMEIEVLKVQNFKQEELIKASLSKPVEIYRSIKSLVQSANQKTNNGLDFVKNDLISGVSSLIVPVLLNGVLFRKSGVFVKSLVWILSRKAAKQVNADTFSGIVEKAKSFISDKIPAIFSQKRKRPVAQTTPTDAFSAS